VSRATALGDQQTFRRSIPLEHSPTSLNEITDQQAWYEELMRHTRNLKDALGQAEPSFFTLEASPSA